MTAVSTRLHGISTNRYSAIRVGGAVGAVTNRDLRRRSLGLLRSQDRDRNKCCSKQPDKAPSSPVASADRRVPRDSTV